MRQYWEHQPNEAKSLERKDVLYCDQVSSKKRKDCIVILNILLKCLIHWFAPIFVFTTEEIYNLVKKDNKSIHLCTFPNIPKNWKNETLGKKWIDLQKIKQKVNIAVEEKRAAKEIGSSLESSIEISTDKKNFDLMEDLDMAEYFITSKAKKILNKDDKLETKIYVKKAGGVKCPRCWKIVDDKCDRCEKARKEQA